jgi:hypothetical protein
MIPTNDVDETGLPDGIFLRPKMSISVYFGRPWDEKFWCTSRPFGIFIAILVYFMAMLLPFCYIFTNFVFFFTEKNLATLQ